MLDPGCQKEDWITFCLYLVQELLDSGDNLRHKSSRNTVLYKRSNLKPLKRPRPGSDEIFKYGLRCRGGNSTMSIKYLPYALRTKKCVFCGRARASYKCRSCKMHLCIKPPETSASGIRFPLNGPPCYVRFHGINKYT